MNINVHKSADRGFADYGEVRSYHSFNFAGYFNPLREKFGVIRVLNDEILSPGGQIQMDNNRNLEMLLIPLKGFLKVISSDGYTGFADENQIQLFSAGSGLDLTIENSSNHASAELLQVWLFPKIKNTVPYSRSMDLNGVDNLLLPIAAPVPSSDCLPLNQDAYISILKLQGNHQYEYHLKEATNLVFVFVVKGTILISEETVSESESNIASVRDSAEISDTRGILNFAAVNGSEILIIETPPD